MQKKILAEKLNVVLADTYSIYLKTQNYHWNVTGSNFHSLHLMFQSQYEELAIAIDDIAEKIRVLGEFVQGSFSSFSKLTNIEEAKDRISAENMIIDLVDSYQILISSLSDALSVCQYASIESLIVDRISVATKTLWMLQSSLSN